MRPSVVRKVRRSRQGVVNYVPFCLPFTGDLEKKEVIASLNSGWLTTGPKVALFEERFRKFVGARHAVALNSCTAALHLALHSAGVKHGDEVVTSPYGFPATGEAILYVGARPVFADIVADTLNIEPAAIDRVLTRKTRAIIPVHIAGLPCEMKSIRRIARGRKIKIIEDAAHALGATVGGRPVGSLSDVTCFSFYATKNLTTGEGGMATTDNERMAARMRRLSLHGLTHDAWGRYSRGGSWRYDVVEMGYKYNMTDLAAALGLAQLSKFTLMQRRRREIAKRYSECLRTCGAFDLPSEVSGSAHAWHLYIIRIRPRVLRITRAQLIEQLRARGVATSVHFLPMHLHSYYRRTFGYRKGDFPRTEAESGRALSLPLYPGLTRKAQERTIGTLLDLVHRFRK